VGHLVGVWSWGVCTPTGRSEVGVGLDHGRRTNDGQEKARGGREYSPGVRV